MGKTPTDEETPGRLVAAMRRKPTPRRLSCRACQGAVTLTDGLLVCTACGASHATLAELAAEP